MMCYEFWSNFKRLDLDLPLVFPLLLLRPSERQNIPTFVVSQNLKHWIFQIYWKYCVIIVSQNFRKNVTKLNVRFEVKNVVCRTWERWNILTFVASQNLKHRILQIFCIYRKYRIKIVSKNSFQLEL